MMYLERYCCVMHQARLALQLQDCHIWLTDLSHNHCS